jgi:hypothetical protein
MAIKTRYFLKAIITCEACQGTGRMQHPAWKAYWEAHPQGLGSPDELRDWFEKSGWNDGLYEPADVIPGEEIPCFECEGNGTLETEVDLSVALADLAQAADSDLVSLMSPRKEKHD